MRRVGQRIRKKYLLYASGLVIIGCLAIVSNRLSNQAITISRILHSTPTASFTPPAGSVKGAATIAPSLASTPETIRAVPAPVNNQRTTTAPDTAASATTPTGGPRVPLRKITATPTPVPVVTRDMLNPPPAPSFTLSLGPAKSADNYAGLTIHIDHEPGASSQSWFPSVGGPQGMPCNNQRGSEYIKSFDDNNYEWYCNWVNSEWTDRYGDYPIRFSVSSWTETKYIYGTVHYRQGSMWATY